MRQPIRVVLVVDDLGYGGAERQVVELANNMDCHRFDIHVCALSDHVPLRSMLREEQCCLHIINKVNRFDFTVVLRLARLLRNLNADIVHGYLFSAEIASRLAGRMARTKLVVGSERNANRLIIKRSNILAYRLTQRCVDIIIANSNVGAKSHREVYNLPPENYRVVHNGVDTEIFRPTDGLEIRDKFGISLKYPVIGAFANFKKQKNHAMLFRAFKLVVDFMPDVRLLLVGERPVDSRGRLDSYKAELNSLLDELGIRERCIFLGHQDTVEGLYSACDITVLPSLHEGTPNVLLESMACAVPVVATNICDNSYVVKDGETGFLVEVGDIEGMAACMKTLLDNDTMCRGMGQKARQWMQDKFSLEQLARKTEAVYIEALRNKCGNHKLRDIGKSTVNRI